MHRLLPQNTPMYPKVHDVPSGSESEPSQTFSAFLQETINGGSLRHVDLHTGSNGWSSPPSDLFLLRSKSFFSRRLKSPCTSPYLLRPAAVDWLRSPSRLDNLLSLPYNRIATALTKHYSQKKPFIFAVNLQIPGRECHSSAFYFATDEIVQPDSLLYKFINGDDAFRNSRFKLVSRIVKGPWIVKTAVGNYGACLLGKALTCRYHRGENYLEIDVDIGSSAIANAILHLALGYVTSVVIDMGFVIEGQCEEELPEKLIGAVRIMQMEMGSATYVETGMGGRSSGFGKSSKVIDDSENLRKG